MDDWGAVRARLEKYSQWQDVQMQKDIRAALERDEQQMAHIKTLQEIGSKAQVEATALRQRVEELEREIREREHGIARLEEWGRGLTVRAEAAEAKLARCVEDMEAIADAAALAAARGGE